MILFTTPWCKPCDILRQRLTDLGVMFEEINVEDQPDEAKNFDIRAVPTLVTSKGEKKVGNPPLPILKEWLDAQLKN
jgi:thioredoxin-like negative regulator of GroEL